MRMVGLLLCMARSFVVFERAERAVLLTGAGLEVLFCVVGGGFGGDVYARLWDKH